jgi:hypothetical protein
MRWPLLPNQFIMDHAARARSIDAALQLDLLISQLLLTIML